jgi:hypothetical protein
LPEAAAVPEHACDNVDEHIQPDEPEHDDDSPTWANYWTRKRSWQLWERAEQLRAAQPQDDDDFTSGIDYYSDSDSLDEQTPAFRQEDFIAPPLLDGSWNHSSHVSKIISTGFKISVDINQRGKAPPPLRFAHPAEAAYVEQLISDGILEEGEVSFTVPHFFIRKPGKLRLIFNGIRLNRACKKPPKFNMKSHSTIGRLCAVNSFHAADDLSNMFFSNKIAESHRKYFGMGELAARGRGRTCSARHRGHVAFE